MSMQVNRFEAKNIDRVDKSNMTIIDHKTDENIIHIHSENMDQKDTEKVAVKIIEALEDLITNDEIKYE